jgi:glycosyltransferase involved in cell wall biosynthesis
MKLAAVTTCYNEREYVRQFLVHYVPQVDFVLIIDNESTDGTVEMASAFSQNVRLSSYRTGDRFDGNKKQEALVLARQGLIGHVDYVLLLDVDELVVPKDGGTIREALNRLPGHSAYGTSGYDIYTYPGDPPYDSSLPVLAQRKRGVQDSQYSKPIVIKPEYEGIFSLGCHYFINTAMPELTPFNLCHIKGFDDELYIERCLRFTSRVKDHKNNYGGGGSYYWLATRKDYLAKLSYEKTASRVIQVIP